MNYKTTLVLLALVAAGGAVAWLTPELASWLGLPPARPTGADAGTLRTLQEELTPQKLERIAIQHGQRLVVLERGPGNDWTLPGRWPARTAEVEELVRLLTGLRSRFVPIPIIDPAELKSYGLGQPPVTVTVRTAGKTHRLAFGEEPGTSDRFSWPTYLRLDDNPEVVRLAPGLVAALDRPADYYQQRRLFPSERVAQESDSQEKTERLLARSIAVKGTSGSYRLEKEGEDWWLQEPVRDHVDPDKLKTLLGAIPDIWAEQFVVQPKTDLAEYGLKEPEQTVRVRRSSGDTTLLIGKLAETKTRTVTRAAPSFGGPPLPPQRELVHEEYRFAKLQDNDQIFEIKADKLKELFVPADSLRDANLARFRGEDARRLEIDQGGQQIVLAKEKDKWVVQKPLQADAENSKVTELLDKLSGLQARAKDIIDHADARAYGLDKPAATIKLTVEEEGKGEGASRTRKRHDFTFLVGKHAADKARLYVQVAGRERINAVEDSILKLVERSPLAYRSRRVFDFTSADLAQIEVRRGKEAFTLEQVKDSWRLAAPVQAEVDGVKAGQLAGDLARLEAVEYVTDSAAPEKLEPLYGLGKPLLSATVKFTDTKKPAQTLLLGKQRDGKPEYFARLASGTAVFVIKKELHDALDQDSLAYRPLQLWQLTAEEIKEVRLRKNEPEYQLKRDGQAWKLTGPFAALAWPEATRPMTEELARLRCERYAAHTAADLTTYGLDQPYLRLSFVTTKKAGSKEETKNRTLLLGKAADNTGKSRFAKLEDEPAIFILGERTVSALDHSALDFLDRQLLTLEPDRIERIEQQGTSGRLTLQRQGGHWQVVASAAAPFGADDETMAAVLRMWSNLRAQRFAAYGPQVNLAAYGLDQPEMTVRVTLKSDKAKKAQPVEHRLQFGKAAAPAAGDRFARLDDGPGVVVLAADVANELTHGYLDFVSRTVLRFDADKATAVRRRMGNESLEIVKRGEGWQLLKPADHPADAPLMGELLTRLGNLRAKRVAAYPAKELKPFQLDNPRATLTIRLTGADGKPQELELQIGQPVEATKPDGDCFGIVAKGNAVFVVPGELARRLTAAALEFRNHNLAHLQAVDRVTLERDRRKAVFTKGDGIWKLTEPVAAEAEQTELEEFVNAVARLRADELVADHPPDLKPYGLDRPEARWRFQAGEKEVLTLLLGSRVKLRDAKAKEGERCYAKLAAGNLVFLLSPQLTAKAFGEYRTRTIWPALDAAQIDKLSYGYTERPFALERVENAWRVVGKADAKVNADVIRETLDALASLKAARYVVDKDAELKLYGLEPPQLTLEIHSPSGSRVLHIGRPEGGSKRYYARVPEENSSAVFLIAEGDGARIIKSLHEFEQDRSKVHRVAP